MAILAECPVCHNKQAVKNKLCSCGQNLDKAKQAKRVRYWIQYRLANKQRKEFVGTSIEEAKDADGKRRVQKRENRIFEILPEAKMTLEELSKWYMGLEKTQSIKTCWRIDDCLNNWHRHIGDYVVRNIKPTDLEAYQVKRIRQGMAKSTIDKELSVLKAVIQKAFDNDLVGGKTLKVFKQVSNLQNKSVGMRRRVLTMEEYVSLYDNAPLHLKAVLQTAFYTGMRQGEILSLTWEKIDLESQVIRLWPKDTKEGKAKVVPIASALREAICGLPRGLHESHVFLFRGKPVSDIRGGVRRACRDAGIVYGQKKPDGFTFHDIRRTVKTFMARAGMPKVYRDTILGHALRGMDAYYMIPSEEDLVSAIARYASWVESQIQNVTQTVTQIKKTKNLG